jgi:hypothetical protein
LQLNGFGLRTYSLLGIHIYVAALYLEHLSIDPEQIIRSPETKVLTVRFERNVSADDARKAWRDGLENNCMAPCHLALEDVEKFLADIPAMHTGDSYSLVFTQHGATVTVGGHLIGTVSQRQFAEAMLATFLGLRPASPRLKRELLRGMHDLMAVHRAETVGGRSAMGRRTVRQGADDQHHDRHAQAHPEGGNVTEQMSIGHGATTIMILE